MNHRRLMAISAAAALLSLAGCGQRSPEQFANVAVSGTPEEQEKAVLDLGSCGPSAVPQLRRVMEESKAPHVKAAAMQALGGYKDMESVPMMFTALDDPDPLVRGRAAAAITNIIGADCRYRAEDPPQKRRATVAMMRGLYETLLKKPAADN